MTAIAKLFLEQFYQSLMPTFYLNCWQLTFQRSLGSAADSVVDILLHEEWS